jgi:hypothetical protein
MPVEVVTYTEFYVFKKFVSKCEMHRRIVLILSGHGIQLQIFGYGLLYLMAAYPSLLLSTHCEAEDLLHHQH